MMMTPEMSPEMTPDFQRFLAKTVPWLRANLSKLKGSDHDRQEAIKRLAKRKGIWLPLGWAAYMW